MPPKPKQKFKTLLRQQIQSKVMVTNDNYDLIPMVPTPNNNFATINKARLRLTKSSPSQIPLQPKNVVSPVTPPAPPPTMSLSNMNGKPRLTTIEVDTPTEPTGQA